MTDSPSNTPSSASMPPTSALKTSALKTSSLKTPVFKTPDWVRWLAQDRSGAWWGYEAEPNLGDGSWYENEVGRYVRLGEGAANPHWEHTLQRVKRVD
ncbi:MAG: hypothetical protein ACPGUC_06935 [Gammaproteobacteria bacterium]